MKSFSVRLFLVGVILSALPAWAAGVRVYPAPAGEELSRDYAVEIEGRSAPVYTAKVAPADPAQRWKAMDDKTNSAAYYTQASFASFDMQGAVTIKVTCRESIQSARVLPSSFQLKPTIQGRGLTLTLTEPRPVTVEVNGNWVGALHLFANPPESDVPRASDPNTVYFGPGIHEVSHLVVSNNVRFEDIRIEESPRLISLWIDKASWTRDVERGHIDGVVFQNIRANAQPLRVELKGFDDTHAIENVSFQSVVVNGKPLTSADVRKNEFVRNVTVQP